ncbi:MAG TPA: terminase family protein [Ktedonobacteraceae bacterium]|nr:terminase family protein [Ktedonobacteraceae bacterium]
MKRATKQSPLSLEAARAFAALPKEQKAAFIAELTDAEALQLQYLWEAWARDKQLEPRGYWTIWLLMCGRGYGKTRVGAEWIRKQSKTYGRLGLIGRTAADVRDVMVEGESGILAVSPPWERPVYQPSKRRLTWPNGATATTYSADEPDSLRGPQHEKMWLDEPGAWQYEDAFDQAMFGLRLGDNPQAVATTTPKVVPLIKRLLKLKNVHVTVGTTYENEENLAPTFLQQVVGRYAGTRLGRQELYAEMLEDVEGALWNRALLDATRVLKAPELLRVVVGVDPAVTSNEGSDETGIVVAGEGIDHHAYVLADYTLKGSPLEWAQAVVTAYHLFQADRVIGEANNGGDLIEMNIRTVDPNISYKSVHAMRGKQLRAEPIVSLYEQHRAHHVGTLPYLEDEQCNWVQGEKSPNRLDAAVWALTELDLNGGAIPFATTSSTYQPDAGPALYVPQAGEMEDAEQQSLLERQEQLSRLLNSLRSGRF